MEQKGRMAELAWTLKKANYADETMMMVNSALRTLIARGANLTDPETVKEVIARQNRSENRRRNVANAYDLYANKYGIKWQKPRTSFRRKLPFIPKEDELDALIADSRKKLATFLLLLKETGMRSGEATKLIWIDLDQERRVIILNAPEKGSNPRMWRISTRLLGMLESLARTSEHIFGNPDARHIRASFCNMRKTISQ
jgi:integrase